jgi:hypothetical protein
VPDADSANEVVSGRNRLAGAISHPKARSRDRAWIGGFNSPVIQPAKTAIIGSLATVLAKLWSRFLYSNVRSARHFGPGTIPATIMRQSTGLRCSILYIAGNLKPLWRSGDRMSADQAAGFFTSAQDGLAQRNPSSYLRPSGG